MTEVTVAIPVRNGGSLLAGVLEALDAQTVAHELLICDTESMDGSAQLVHAHGARVLRIAPARFSHGGARNLLMREARGSYVALLTQDAEPADERWLERMLSGFELAAEVGIVYGPYRPRPQSALPIRLELERWFASLAPDGRPRVDRLSSAERDAPARALLGARGFFTDANACVKRAAWERVPFREVAYAEDRLLALEMLRAGYAKAFVPDAAVLHSHDYGPAEQLRRSFDEWRGLREVYGWREPVGPRHLARQLRGELGYTRRRARSAEPTRADTDLPGLRKSIAVGVGATTLAAVGVHHMLRLAGAALGSRADMLPARVRRWLSLERRASFELVDFADAAEQRKNRT